MKRLLATIRCDLILQYRNGFYFVTAFVVVFWIVLFTQLPRLDLSAAMAGFLIGNLEVNTFYYIAGLVLLEKGEGTLEAQVVTPLRDGEYLASKLITLILLALAENLLLALVLVGPGFSILPFVAGLSAASAIYILYGFLVVARYDSVNEFLMPSILYTILVGLPLLGYFQIVPGWGWYLHPIYAPLTVLRAAFGPIQAWEWVYGLAGSALWVAVFFILGRRTFHRFVIAREGVH